ncbi:MAG: ATP-dependent hsl protease ATP-binding subunit hslU [Planctomycetaceae bacterium]|nr:ATP-dependent hsl protease ATP-binding subunit hslU [Planctomycetaceae bacterium]
MSDMTPRQLVAELDRHIVGQSAAKRAVAIAIRNRWRWQQLDPEIRRDVTPKNILMIGPTGVGKTEITRRLAKILNVPFIKVEATKYTEVGYHGRDVESMVRDLVEAAITLVRVSKRAEVETKAKHRTEQRILDLLMEGALEIAPEGESDTPETVTPSRTRKQTLALLQTGKLEEELIHLSVEQRSMPVQVFSNMGLEQMDVDFQSMFEKILPKQTRSREIKVREARQTLMEQEIDTLMDRDAINEEAVGLAERSGIIFIDELDKICGPEGTNQSIDVSRQGVQRDLLPVVEGTTVQTRYGAVSTEHILFIAAGAFHRSKPSDLMPELQGRFPIRVELTDLVRDDFVRILTEPTSSVTRQYQALLGADGIKIKFTPDGIAAMADIAYQVNQSTQNIGARRLHTIMEKLLEDVSFEGPNLKKKAVNIDGDYVRGKLSEIIKNEDLSRFIL